jgi:hypothetical protein
MNGKDQTRPDYAAMADAILQVAAELRRQGEASGNAEQIALAERLERVASGLRAPAPGRSP